MATTGASAGNISEQYVREAPDIEAYKIGLMKSAQALQAPTLPDYQVAAMTDQQKQAITQGQQGIGAYIPYMEGAGKAVEQGIGTLGTAVDQTKNLAMPIGQQQIEQYMNPFSNLALQQQMQEMNRQAQIQQQGLNAQATRAGAFGGSRQGIQQAELGRNLSQTQNQAIAQSMQQNYAQALAAAQQQQGVGLTAAGQLANMGTQYGNLATQQAGVGKTSQELGQNDTNFLFNIGAQQQKQAQAVIDAQRATAMQNAMQPYQQLAFQSDIYKGAPSTQMSMTQQSAATPSPFQQITGVGTGILGLAGATNVLSKNGII